MISLKILLNYVLYDVPNYTVPLKFLGINILNNVHSVQISHFFGSHKMVSIFETFANPANCRMQIKYQLVFKYIVVIYQKIQIYLLLFNLFKDYCSKY